MKYLVLLQGFEPWTSPLPKAIRVANALLLRANFFTIVPNFANFSRVLRTNEASGPQINSPREQSLFEGVIQKSINLHAEKVVKTFQTEIASGTCQTAALRR